MNGPCADYQVGHVQHVWVGAHAIMFLLPAKERS